MRRLALIALGATAALIAAASPATAAPPAAGDYEAEPVLDDATVYTSGIFTVVKEGTSRRIVASEGRAGIYYPDVGECDDLDLPLTALSIPISAAGRFKAKEKFPVEGAETVTVNWRGRWTKPRRVSGTITIKSGKCSSTEDWKGSRLR